MIKKIYVAGASSEIERAEKWMGRLREAGFEVTSTWPEVIRAQPNGEANPMTAPREQRAEWAAVDLEQVSQSSAFWLLLPTEKPTIGAYWEVGFFTALIAVEIQMRAVGAKLTMRYALCSGVEKSIFTTLIDHFATDEEAFAALTTSMPAPKTKEPTSEEAGSST